MAILLLEGLGHPRHLPRHEDQREPVAPADKNSLNYHKVAESHAESMALVLVREYSMSNPPQEFGDLLRRARTGDGAAAAELIRQYEPEIRRAIRLRMSDPRLRRVVDSMDVCQSVLANFFVRVSAGQYDLQRPEELIALLVAMVRNKVVDQARRFRADKRDQRRVDVAGDSVLARVPSAAATPEQRAADRDLLAEVRRRLDDDERHLADQRALGREWAEIAAELNVNADAIRKKLTRALNRVSLELGLDESHDE